jgi:hypothetical protein
MVTQRVEYTQRTGEEDYIRMKVGDILMLCLDDSSSLPIHQLVESLILVGPESLDVMREILKETAARKAQLNDDRQQVFIGFKTNLESYGVQLVGARHPDSVLRIKPGKFYSQLLKQGIEDETTRKNCLQLFQDSRELLVSLNMSYSLLERIETYLEDWINAVYFMQVHQKDNPYLM